MELPEILEDVVMAAPTIQFTDGAAYDRMMGVWSRMVGEVFLDWLNPAPGLTWADIGCGSGAFSNLLAARCAPAKIYGIDPSEAQLTQARKGPAAGIAEFQLGDAMALPYEDNCIDAAAMALVLFFVPDPAKGVAEMKRVVKPGGSVSAYMWDMLGGGVPMQPLYAELGPTGIPAPMPPSVSISTMDAMRAAWMAAGFVDIETRVVSVRRSFADFEEFWAITASSVAARTALDRLSPEALAALKERVRPRMSPAADGTISYDAWCNAIKGRKPQTT